MLELLRRLVGRAETRVPPLMVRTHTGRGTARLEGEVSVDALWLPSGTRRTYRAKDAQGLCMLPWMKQAERVSLRVRADGAETAIEVHVDDARTGRTIDLALG